MIWEPLVGSGLFALFGIYLLIRHTIAKKQEQKAKREKEAKVQEFHAKVRAFLREDILWLPEGELRITLFPSKDGSGEVLHPFTADELWRAASAYITALEDGKILRREFSDQAEFLQFVHKKINTYLLPGCY